MLFTTGLPGSVTQFFWPVPVANRWQPKKKPLHSIGWSAGFPQPLEPINELLFQQKLMDKKFFGIP